jgi:hypothetical protein
MRDLDHPFLVSAKNTDSPAFQIFVSWVRTMMGAYFIILLTGWQPVRQETSAAWDEEWGALLCSLKLYNVVHS